MSEAILSQILASLNRIEGKVDTNHSDLNNRLDKHMHEEEGKISEFKEQVATLEDLIEESNRNSEKRHANLIQSMTGYMEEQNTRQAAIEEAFIDAANGKKDYIGHRNDHHERTEAGKTWRRRFDTIIMAVLVSATVGAMAWLGRLVWIGLLQGPVK